MKIMREIIEINEELCDGCGQCVPSCAEGALAVVDGKVRLVKDSYCDGLGACLGECPRGALRVVQREAEAFDEEAAMEHVARTSSPCGGCPGAGLATFAAPDAATGTERDAAPESLLGHWPVQIRLCPPDAPFLSGAHLVLAADCAAVAHPDFHRALVGGNVVLLGCPKFDGDYAPRLAELFRASGVARVTVVRMEVPCCAGLPDAARRALAASGRTDLSLTELVVGRQGGVTRAQAASLQTL
ncbi:ATP-binding protein [Desulfocurvus sp. DL9XJH121]